MSEHSAVSPREAAARLAIREHVEAFAYCADRRDAKDRTSLFTADTISPWSDDRATGEACDAWLFSERPLCVAWADERGPSWP